MKLAINFSHQAADLVRKGKIEIDLFKSPDWAEVIEQAAEIRPVGVHFDLNVPFSNSTLPDWQCIAALREQTGTPYVNAHFAPRSADFDARTPGETVESIRNRMIEAAIQDLDQIIERFGAENVILENYPYHAQDEKWSCYGAHPDVIKQIVCETGCGLLLDISHARISAHAIGMDEHSYMGLLPIETLRELQFTGIHNLDGRLTDHLPVLDSDWPVLEWVLERISCGHWPPAWMLAFEYGGVGEKFAHRSHASVIAEQVPRMYVLVHAV